MKLSSVVAGIPKTCRTPRSRSISKRTVLACIPFPLAWETPAPPRRGGGAAGRAGGTLRGLRATAGIGTTSVVAARGRGGGQLVFLRAVQGGVSGFVAASNALVTASIPPDRMGAALGVLQTSLTAGGIIGPLIGGALADLVGYRNVFLITGVACYAAAVIVLRGAHEDAPPAHARTGGPGVLSNLGAFFRTPALRTTGLLLCTTQIAIMSVE